MSSSNDWDQIGQGRRFRPKPFDFSFILNPSPPVASDPANSIDSLSPADETASQTTPQEPPLANEPALCRRGPCHNPVRANCKHCGDCLDKMAARRRAWIQKRRSQGSKDPITGEPIKICAKCFVPSDKRLCGRCSKRQSVSSLAFYHRRREKGLCGRCGVELDRDGFCCQACHAKDLVNARRRYQKKKNREHK